MENVTIVDFGYFTGETVGGVCYMKDESGNDWYEMLKALTTWDIPTGAYVNAVYGTFMTYNKDTGEIAQIEFDPTRIVPWFLGLIAVDAAYTDYPKDKKWQYINGEVIEYVAPPIVPDIISDRQFFQQLAIAGLITEDEALAAVMTGTIPQAMEAFVEALPTGQQQFSARMVLCGATTFERSHPLVQAFGAAQGMSDEQIDQLWIDASALK
jgi:hypothetical protein